MVILCRPLLRLFGFGLIAALAFAPLALAQPQSGIVQPTPLESDHPRARQAAALVTELLAGDRDAVIKIMRTEGTPALAKNPELETMVDTQITRLANKGYKIDRFMTGRGADVIVELVGANLADTNIVIRFTPETPHLIEGFAQAMAG
jgi:hypothetical protein